MSGPAVSMRFAVEIQGFDLGTFTAVEGLGARYETEAYHEGGENEFVHQLPKRVEYDNVKISRPLDQSSPALLKWFYSIALGTPMGRRTATITAYNANSERVASWTFLDVLPVRYGAPTFSSEGGKVAIEVLEFTHRGLLPGGAP